MVPKGVTGQWLDGVYWTLAAETAFYGLVYCAMLTKKVTLRHLALGLTIYSAIFNAFSLVVLSCTTPSDLPYLIILMFRVPAAAYLLNHGCFFALGIWLFISANRELTKLERIAVAVTCLSGAAEIYYFASFFLTSIPAIADQSALVPIMVWAAAVLLIAFAANRNRNRRAAGTASREAPAYWRTLGLITYPFYLMHNGQGMKMYGRAEYKEMHKPDRIVYSQQFVDENEKPSRHPMMPTYPSTVLTVINLTEEEPGRTRVTVTWEPAAGSTREEIESFLKIRGGMTMGWTGSFDKLEEYITRVRH